MPYSDKTKQREFNRQWISNRRKAFFAGKSCVICGSTENLELDHIDPSQKISHSIWSWREERRNAELEKCQVLCHSCHLKKTSEWWKSRRTHGRGLYKHGCRCEICFKAQQAHNKKTNIKRKM